MKMMAAIAALISVLQDRVTAHQPVWAGLRSGSPTTASLARATRNTAGDVCSPSFPSGPPAACAWTTTCDSGGPFWNTPYQGTSCTWQFAPTGVERPFMNASFRTAYAVNVSIFDGASVRLCMAVRSGWWPVYSYRGRAGRRTATGFLRGC